MKKRYILIIFIVCILGIGIIIFLNFINFRNDNLPEEPFILNDVDNLKNTIITSYLDIPIIDGKNLIWCGTIKLAWDELCNLAGEKLLYKNKNIYIEHLANEKFSKNDIDSSIYVSMAGFYSEKIADSIERELKTKFNLSNIPMLLNMVKKSGGQILAYSYLYVDLPFECPFERHKSSLKYQGEEVENFGIFQLDGNNNKDINAAKQVLIYFNKDNHDIDLKEYVIEIKTKSVKDQLILANILPQRSFLKTIEYAQKYLKEFKPISYNIVGLSGDIVIPVLNFDLIKNFTELSGIVSSKSKKWDGHEILCMQGIRFKLDEKGAILKSETTFYESKGVNLIFDKAFLIMIKHRDAEIPYFAVWVANPEILVPFEPKNK